MSDFITLAVGRPYPIKLKSEGAIAEFLGKGGSDLIIRLSYLSEGEIKAFKSGKLEAGILTGKSKCLWVFRFFGEGKPLFNLEAVFDATLIPKESICLPSIENEHQRLLINIHVVDETNTIRALRVVTLPHRLTLKFLAHVQDQLSGNLRSDSDAEYWNTLTVSDLVKKIKLYELGG